MSEQAETTLHYSFNPNASQRAARSLGRRVASRVLSVVEGNATRTGSTEQETTYGRDSGRDGSMEYRYADFVYPKQRLRGTTDVNRHPKDRYGTRMIDKRFDVREGSVDKCAVRANISVLYSEEVHPPALEVTITGKVSDDILKGLAKHGLIA